MNAALTRPDLHQRFVAIVARALAKIEREERALLAALRAQPMRRLSYRASKKPTQITARNN